MGMDGVGKTPEPLSRVTEDLDTVGKLEVGQKLWVDTTGELKISKGSSRRATRRIVQAATRTFTEVMPGAAKASAPAVIKRLGSLHKSVGEHLDTLSKEAKSCDLAELSRISKEVDQLSLAINNAVPGLQNQVATYNGKDKDKFTELKAELERLDTRANAIHEETQKDVRVQSELAAIVEQLETLSEEAETAELASLPAINEQVYSLYAALGSTAYHLEELGRADEKNERPEQERLHELKMEFTALYESVDGAVSGVLSKLFEERTSELVEVAAQLEMLTKEADTADQVNERYGVLFSAVQNLATLEKLYRENSKGEGLESFVDRITPLVDRSKGAEETVAGMFRDQLRERSESGPIDIAATSFADADLEGFEVVPGGRIITQLEVVPGGRIITQLLDPTKDIVKKSLESMEMGLVDQLLRDQTRFDDPTLIGPNDSRSTVECNLKGTTLEEVIPESLQVLSNNKPWKLEWVAALLTQSVVADALERCTGYYMSEMIPEEERGLVGAPSNPDSSPAGDHQVEIVESNDGSVKVLLLNTKLLFDPENPSIQKCLLETCTEFNLTEPDLPAILTWIERPLTTS
jgi:hypothetical protein